MGKLVLTDDGKVVGEHELDKERVTIGRHPDNDISLNDKATSGYHAVVITILSDSFLEDLDSTNGTLVNGKQVAKHPLSSGDVITIGRHQLKFEGEIADEEEFEKTMILRPSDMAAAKKAKEAPPAAAPKKPQIGKLKIQSGPNQGAR